MRLKHRRFKLAVREVTGWRLIIRSKRVHLVGPKGIDLDGCRARTCCGRDFDNFGPLMEPKWLQKAPGPQPPLWSNKPSGWGDLAQIGSMVGREMLLKYGYRACNTCSRIANNLRFEERPDVNLLGYEEASS